MIINFRRRIQQYEIINMTPSTIIIIINMLVPLYVCVYIFSGHQRTLEKLEAHYIILNSTLYEIPSGTYVQVVVGGLISEGPSSCL